VYFQLTGLGKKVCTGHEKHRKKINAGTDTFIDRGLFAAKYALWDLYKI
jgi:hypothetical protein